MSEEVYQPARGVGAKIARRGRYALGCSHALCRPARGVLTICFDDFPKSAAANGAPALEAFGARGTYFASGGFAGGQDHAGPMFDAGDVIGLSRRGHEIGCHTFSHLDCAQASVENVIADVERNARALKAMGLDSNLESFAFPYGEASPAAKRALAQKFTAIRGVRADLNRGSCDRGLLKSACIDGGEAQIDRATGLIAAAARNPAWVVLFAHGVEHSEGDWACTPDQLSTCLRAARAVGLDVLTFGEAAKVCLTPQAARRGLASWFTTSPAGKPPRASTSSARM